MNLITFSDPRPAQVFRDYLSARGIPCRVVDAGEGFAVALDNAGDGPRALEEARDFVAEPQHPRYRQVAAGRGEAAPAEARGGAPADGWWSRAGWSTRTVAALCLLVYLALHVDPRAVFTALSFPADLSLAFTETGWWRLLTPAFLHFGLLHIAFNLLWWWELGGQIEREQSAARLLLLTVVIAVLSNVAQFLAYGPQFGGLSAVVYGLLGYLWLYPVTDPGARFRLRPGIVVFMLAWLAIGYSGLLDLIFDLRVSNHGHLAGLVAGAVLGLLLGLVHYRPPRFEA